jgi:MinD-like ATPase involved in chromosome partitioning or flagellar assembly
VTGPGFDEAWASAQAVALTESDAGRAVTVVRDVVGRITCVIDDPGAVASLGERLSEQLGAYASGVRLREDVPWIVDLESLPEAVVMHGGPDGRLVLVERTVTGADWARPASKADGNRVTLYGFKGGVGRSTATFLLAESLAMRGMSVLVVDLDLESPGVGTLVQPDDGFPDQGVVDHLVEEAVGSGRDLDLVVRSTRCRTSGNGEVWLAPARGRARDGYSYLPKLNRIYADTPAASTGDRPLSFAHRLDRAVSACEEQVERRSRRPEVVLLDSRAGIHDIAAVAITRLADLSLLFASDTPATWAGYRELFTEWARRPDQARLLRERLKMVAVHVATAEQDQQTQLTKFRDHSQECFAATLYDDIGAKQTGDDLGENLPGAGIDASSTWDDLLAPARDDLSAPHSPLPIPHLASLVGLDPDRPAWQADPVVEEAYSEFTSGVVDLIGSPT